jgi:hypothetical protein
MDKGAVDPHTLFGLLKPLQEGCGMVVGGDGPGNPFPGILETLLVQRDACQGLRHSPKRKVSQSQI